MSGVLLGSGGGGMLDVPRLDEALEARGSYIPTDLEGSGANGAASVATAVAA